MSNRRQCLIALSALVGTALIPLRASARRASGEPHTATALELSAGLKSRRWSARELAEHHLRRIEALNGAFDRYDDNGALNAFIRIYPDLARRASRRADRARAHVGWSGVPVALKDVFSVADRPVTVGSPAFRSYRAAHDCTLWRTWKNAGAVLLGHTQAQRFISGITTPQTANPWHRDLIAGGSSGGSAAAVAAGMVPVALGTETAGSLIYPALCCAVTTLKPSLGLLSLWGVFPGAKSFDVAGPLARSAADCAWVMATLTGLDPDDPVTAEQKGHELAWPEFRGAGMLGERPLRGVRFLVATNERYTGGPQQKSSDEPQGSEDVVDPRVQRGFDKFLRSLTELGAEIVPAAIAEDLGNAGIFNRKDPRFGNQTARTILATADAISTSLPVMRRWLEHASPAEWEIAMKKLGAKDRSLEGEALLANAALLTPQTLQMAMAEREKLRSAWESLLDQQRCDAHIYLEVGSPLSRRKGLEDTPGPSGRRTGVRPNDLGWPVLSLPVSLEQGLDVPISAQLMARRWHDPRLLAWGMIWQQQHPEFLRPVPLATHDRSPD